jgi:hypothetical protein
LRRKLVTLGVISLIILGINGCSKNKFKLVRSQPTDIPYYNPVNDTCFICHNVSTLKKTITTSLGEETVPLYVNRDKFARSTHRGQNCQDCHTDIVLHKGHPDVPKTYGGWANFSAEDTLLTRNYTTQAAIACPTCHGRSSFLSSQHYLIGKIKASHAGEFSGIQIGRDYDKAKCGKCHLTCATCHFKGTRIQQSPGDITDFWSVLLTGGSVSDVDGMTNWSIDWTTNVESHDFAVAEDLESSNDLCRMCHTGYYTSDSTTGYYHFTIADTLNWVSLISQGVEKYPQYEEWRFLKGDISIITGTNPSLDSIYARIENSYHYSRECIDCHNEIHSLTPINCLKCHNNKLIPRGEKHSDIACVACHDATMNVWRDPDADDTVRVAAIKNNKVVNWHSHLLIKPDDETTDFCDRKCHNPETGRRIGAPWSEHHHGSVHDD